MMEAVKISVLCLSLSPTFPCYAASPSSLWVGITERGREEYVAKVEHRQMANSTPNRPTSGNKAERPRFFDAKAKSICWAKADVVPGRHPERWRKDAAGNIVCKRFFNCLGCLCFEYDHIIPYSKGGESSEDNCQILQSRVNRFKSDQEFVDKSRLEGYSCDVKFTGMTRWKCQLRRPYVGYNVCSGPGLRICWHQRIYKELDLIEMAVYGDVIRPGNECRCRTVAEMLGKYRSRDNKEACKLP